MCSQQTPTVMKKLHCILLISSIAFIIPTVNAQEETICGSNNGQYITIQNSQIYYEEYGDGIPLILLHGGFSSMYYYGMVIPELSKHSRIIAVDSPGHGRSYQADSMSYQLISDYVSELIDVMKLDSVYLLCCCDGSIIALLLAHDRPDKVKRIISDGGLVRAEGYKPAGIELIESVTPETRSKSWVDWYKSINPQKDQWEKFILDTKEMWLDLPYIIESKIQNIKVRTLIIMGDRDRYITLEEGLYLYRNIPGSEFCVFPNLGHCICNEDPDLINKVVINFLSKQ